MTRIVEQRSGVLVSVEAAETSAGAADAGRIPQLDATGKLDSSMIPASGSVDADKLDGQDGTYYLARANHTGTQLAATISDLSTAVAALNALTATTLQTSRNFSIS